jgi:hypothetical protein
MRVDVAPEVQQHGQLGADLDDRRERGARIQAGRQEGPDDAQVRARRNREEFGQALDHAQEHCLEPADGWRHVKYCPRK